MSNKYLEKIAAAPLRRFRQLGTALANRLHKLKPNRLTNYIGSEDSMEHLSNRTRKALSDEKAKFEKYPMNRITTRYRDFVRGGESQDVKNSGLEFKDWWAKTHVS